MELLKEFWSNFTTPEKTYLCIEEAMTNEVVLRVLAKHTSPSDFKSCRSVNSQWNLIMTPGHYQNSTVTFKTLKKMLLYTIEMDPAPQQSLRHRNFHIHIPKEEGDLEAIVPDKFSSFFTKYSGQVHNLKFVITLSHKYPHNFYVWLGLFQNLGSLTSLDLDVEFHKLCGIYGLDLTRVPVLQSLQRIRFGISYQVAYHPAWMRLDTTVRQLLSGWADIIIRMSPNVRSLTTKKIQFFETDYTGHFQSSLMTSLAILPPRVPNLTDLEMTAVAGTPREILKLTTFIRKLKLIWLPNASQGLQNWIHLNDLLAKNSATLEEITISLKPDLYIGLRLPFMPRLKGFHLKLISQLQLYFPGHKIQFPFGKVDYATTCPLLEELTLDVSSSVTDLMLSPTLPVCQSMKKISTCEESFKLKGRFPNAVIQKLREDKFEIRS